MTDDHDADRQLNLPLGISLTIGEIGLMIVISALVKLVGAEIHTLTILMFRYAGCLPLLVIAALWQRGRHALQISRYRTLAIRTAAGLTSLGCFYAALDLMPLSKAMVLFQTLTLFVTLLAPLILGERVGWRRWTAGAVGFLGTMIVLKPDAEGWTAAGILFGLGSPLFGAIMLIALRRLGQHDSALSTSVWYNGIGTMTFAGLVAVQGLTLPTATSDLMILVALGILSSFQQFFMAFSHRVAPATALAPFRYLAIPMGIVAGILFFGEILTAEIIIGSAIIIASSIFILRRERQLRAAGADR